MPFGAAGELEAFLVERGVRRNIGVIVPDTASAMAILTRSDMIALVPRRFGEAIGRDEVRVMGAPHLTPDLECGMCWRRDRKADPAINWMLDLIRTAANRP